VRVLSIGSLYPPHDRGGGAELVWHSAVGALRERGHEVRVLTTDHRRPGRDDEDEEEYVARELRWYWSEHAFPKRGLREVLAIERHNGAVLERRLDELRPDVVSWFPMGGMSLSLLERVRRHGVPSVSFVHDDWLLYAPVVDAWHARWRRRPRLGRLAERVWSVPAGVDFAGAAHYAFVSARTRERAQRDGLVLRDTSVAHPGISAVFADPAPPREWGWKLLYVGRIDPRKGVATAVRALAELPGEATLTFVGDGADPDIEAVRSEARDAGVADRVRLAGERPHAELPAVYGSADVVVFPVEWEEPWGLVPLEAMGRGRPVVATGRGGSSEYLRDGENALLFEAGDAPALAERVRRIAGDAGLRDRLREEGIATARRHPDEGFNERVERLLLEAAGA
jgi:glycosyltransferase involved in cell wall biosynthesis